MSGACCGLDHLENLMQDLLYASHTMTPERLQASLVTSLLASIETIHQVKSANNFMMMEVNRFIDYSKTVNGFKLVPNRSVYYYSYTPLLYIYAVY